MVFKELVEGMKEKIRLSSKSIPAHIAFAVEGFADIPGSVEKIKDVISAAGKLQVPMLTFHLTGSRAESKQLDLVEGLFTALKGWDELHKLQAKVNVVGKWYQLPQRIIDTVKNVLEETKDYDMTFLNFCIMYDGQEEIADAAKLIARQVKLGKIEPEAIDKALMKEHLYTSYFIPPDLLIKTGKGKKTGGVLLWDSAHSKIYFANKEWSEFLHEDFLKAIEWWQSN